MTQFNESQHPRDPKGQFASKGPAAEETGVQLSSPGPAQSPAQRIEQAQEVVEGFDTSAQQQRDATAMRGMKASIASGLESARRGRRVASSDLVMAYAARREGVGTDEEGHKTILRGMSPHLSDEQVEESYTQSAAALDRAEEIGRDETWADDEDQEVFDRYEEQTDFNPRRPDGSIARMDAAAAWMHEADRIAHETTQHDQENAGR